jgi:hypothetical protein
MSNNKTQFVFTTEQRHLQRCQLRIQGVRTALGLGEDQHHELVRLQAAEQDILSRMSAQDQTAYNTQVNRVLTVAEVAAEARAVAEAMSANRDRPSI